MLFLVFSEKNAWMDKLINGWGMGELDGNNVLWIA
jgi:hypothetical protein